MKLSQNRVAGLSGIHVATLHDSGTIGAFVEFYGASGRAYGHIVEFASRALFIGGVWLLVNGQEFIRRLLPLLPFDSVRLRGSPSKIYSAYVLSTRVDGSTEFRDCDPIMAREPSGAEEGYYFARLAMEKIGMDRPPVSLARMLGDYADAERWLRHGLPVRGSRRYLSGGRQQLFTEKKVGCDIFCYDLRRSYSAPVLMWPVPSGKETVSVDRGIRIRNECVFVDCEVEDNTLYGVLPRSDSGRWGHGRYRTFVAEPLLDVAIAIAGVQILDIHCYVKFRGYSFASLIWDAWERSNNSDTYECEMWRLAIQQFCGKFGERPVSQVYRLTIPGDPSGWRLCDWETGVWARDDWYYPTMYHPPAQAWIHQLAQIPLVRPLACDDVLRVYVDSVTVAGKRYVESDTPGGWRLVATGNYWSAQNAGKCYLGSPLDGAESWSIGGHEQIIVERRNVNG